VIPLHLLLGALVEWLRGEQYKAIEYLREENRVLKAQLENQRPRLTDTTGGAWRSVARLWVVGCWRRWRRLSRRTPFCGGTGS
jgi:hypothetical protein